MDTEDHNKKRGLEDLLELKCNYRQVGEILGVSQSRNGDYSLWTSIGPDSYSDISDSDLNFSSIMFCRYIVISIIILWCTGVSIR